MWLLEHPRPNYWLEMRWLVSRLAVSFRVLQQSRLHLGPGRDSVLLNSSVRKLFCELADVPRGQRERIVAGLELPAGLRAEVESLLDYDSMQGESVTRCVAEAIGQALGPAHGSSDCGPYRLLHPIGTGGMGAVYLAKRDDGEIEQKVAIKMLRADADRPAWRSRFLTERQLLSYLNHPSIARLLDVGHTADGRPYLVMEYVEGIAIDQYAAALDLSRRLELFLLVCEGVSHAHSHSIIHRDLKPQNILVDSSGKPKILDFGIAKVLDKAADQTRTVERLLTPNYASPEQLRGDTQSTATDIYSLGAVLYKLLTGFSPRESCSDDSSRSQKPDGDERIAIPSRLNPSLPQDVDHILLKALCYEPYGRYPSVDALADDIRSVLECKPVRARSGKTWYRIRKFLRRNRAASAAATITMASLFLGVGIANDQRRMARDHFRQVRLLAGKALALDEATGAIHSSNRARVEVVTMSKEYLEALAAEAHGDQNLALEIGRAYSLLARAQGISLVANVGQHNQAEESLRKAETFVEPVLIAHAGNRQALLTAAKISHDRMTIAETDRRTEEAVAQAHKTVGYLERLLSGGEVSAAERETASEFYYDVAVAHKNMHYYNASLPYVQRSIDIGRTLPNGALRVGLGLSLLADLRRLTADLEQALTTIREARRNLEHARFPSEMVRRSSWIAVLWREGKILGAANGLSLNRPGEAIAVLQRAVDLVEEWTQNDSEDAWSRLYFTSLGRELGEILRLRDPQKALAVYDHALLRLHEVKDNTEARRGEVELLAGSAYALRRLDRIEEAKDRIDTGFRLLREIKEYPTEHVPPHSAAASLFRALGDHLAETGQPQQALRVYEDLLSKITVSKPDPLNDLRHGITLSQIYGSLAALHRRSGMRQRGEELAALRLELWRHWDRKLPQNALINRQLELCRMQ